MSLIEITETSHDIILDMRYATANNFTGQPIYEDSRCFLRPEALVLLEKAIVLAAQQGLRIKILDAHRPQYAQERLWAVCPNPDYITPPERGSHHTRGVAVDLTLVDQNNQELDMGTPFDSFDQTSHHGTAHLSPKAAQNRYLLLGIMMSAGWDLYQNEWWHYQFFNPRQFELILNR
jgi:zinc D-Ala-D-Ala dipeptidase